MLSILLVLIHILVMTILWGRYCITILVLLIRLKNLPQITQLTWLKPSRVCTLSSYCEMSAAD